MSQLYAREAFVIVEGIRIEGLRLAFKVEKTLGKKPNEASLQLYNLTKESRAKVQKKGSPMALAAGYQGNMGQLFLGETREGASHVREGPDWVTKLTGGDGHTAFVEAEVAESYGPGTGLLDVVKSLAQKAGVGLGNAVQAFQKGGLRGAMDSFTHGFTANGKASSELDRVLRTAGFSWSIQDGQLQLLRGQEVAAGQAILLTPDTGLVDSPELGKAEKKKGPPLLKAKALLNPALKPGGTIEVEAEGLRRGQYRLRKVTHEGDTAGQAWYSSIEARPL